MSHYKDSSVARTRHKRPHRIPARFEDFSTLPTTQHISSPDLDREISPPPELKPQPIARLSNAEKVIKDKTTSSPIPTTPSPPQPPSAFDTNDINDGLTNLDTTANNTLTNSRSPTPPPPPPPLQPKDQVSYLKKDKDITKINDTNESTTTKVNSQTKSLNNTPIHTKETLQNNNNNLTTKSATRKKSKGYSLIKKHAGSSVFQNATITNNDNNSTANATYVYNTNAGGFISNRFARVNTQQLLQQQQQQQLQQEQQQTAKYYTSNLPQCMQYGTRLMINEPIYLPRNVATIAPITTTLQQMEDQVRKLPFLSEKAKQCLAYQQQRKINCITSNFDALVKITSYLNVNDLLNLRLVNKSWKSIIDSDIIWRKIDLYNVTIRDYSGLGNLLSKYKTTDLIMNDIVVKVSWYKIFETLIRDDVKIERIFIESKTDTLNRHILELLCLLNNYTKRSHSLKICWKVKSHVDDTGLILIPIKTRKLCTLDPNFDLYLYNDHKDWITKKQTNILLELTDITDLFNGGIGDKSETPNTLKPEIIIEPI